MVDENHRPFPEELLLKSKSEIMEHFYNVFVPHRNAKEALELLLNRIPYPAGTSIFLLFGCTGSGKTMLLGQLHKRLNEMFQQELLDDPGRIISSGMEVREEPGKFDYRDFYIRGLETLCEVLIGHKILYPSLMPDDPSRLIVNPSEKTVAAYRRAWEKALENRKLLVFSLDEAQHLLMAAGPGQILRQFDWIKSIANLSRMTHLLCGTYELLNCRTWNGQTGRRSEDIHLARYHAEVKNDYTELVRVIKTFLRKMPLRDKPKLEKYYGYIIEDCLGCVGVLKDWLHRSLGLALDDDAKTLLLKHLKKGALTPIRRQQIREEAERGEQILKQEASGKQQTEANSSRNQEDQPGKNKGNSRPGQRQPKRDPVGGADQLNIAQT